MEIMSENKVKVLDLINRFGVIANKQLFKYFKGDITQHMMYKIISYLAKEGLISKSNIGRVYYVYIRPSATSIVSEPMYNFNRVNQTELLHDLRVNEYLIDQYLKFKDSEKIRSVSFKTEREMIDEYLIEESDEITDSNVTRKVNSLKRHTPDGIFTFVNLDGGVRRMAVEYELNQKNKTMYEKILKRYDNHIIKGDINSVTYIVKGRRIQRKIEEVMKENNYNFRINFLNADEVFRGHD